MSAGSHATHSVSRDMDDDEPPAVFCFELSIERLDGCSRELAADAPAFVAQV